MEFPMMRQKLSKVFGAAAILASALAVASPAISQQVVEYPAFCAQIYPDANCLNYGPGSPYTGSYQLYRGWGGSTPLTHTIAYDRGVHGGDYYGGYAGNPAPRLGCPPGTWFDGPDGHRHRCR
jgi:hypothetical protein